MKKNKNKKRRKTIAGILRFVCHYILPILLFIISIAVSILAGYIVGYDETTNRFNTNMALSVGMGSFIITSMISMTIVFRYLDFLKRNDIIK